MHKQELIFITLLLDKLVLNGYFIAKLTSRFQSLLKYGLYKFLLSYNSSESVNPTFYLSPAISRCLPVSVSFEGQYLY